MKRPDDIQNGWCGQPPNLFFFPEALCIPTGGMKVFFFFVQQEVPWGSMPCPGLSPSPVR